MRPAPPSRTTVGLTPAHRELIRILADIAVTDFLRETETTDEDDNEEVVQRRN